ncbi:MAG: hypothetical protein M1819_006272 [Sarea resinae]|nr:MAG: hypothetical protein M1819_006272 [Sarea resinae]
MVELQEMKEENAAKKVNRKAAFSAALAEDAYNPDTACGMDLATLVRQKMMVEKEKKNGERRNSFLSAVRDYAGVGLEASRCIDLAELEPHTRRLMGFPDTIVKRQDFQDTNAPNISQAPNTKSPKWSDDPGLTDAGASDPTSSVSSHSSNVPKTAGPATITSTSKSLSGSSSATASSSLGSAAAASASSAAAVSSEVAAFTSAFGFLPTDDPSSSSSSHHHISQAALVVAIVIPILAAVAALAFLFLCFRDRRRRRRSPNALEPKPLLPTSMTPWRTRPTAASSIPLRPTSRNSGYYTGLNSSAREGGDEMEPPPPYQHRVSLHDHPIDEDPVFMQSQEELARGGVGGQHLSEDNINTHQQGPPPGISLADRDGIGISHSPFAHPDDNDHDDAVSDVSDTFERRIHPGRDADEVSVISASDVSRQPVRQDRL